jgi:uridine kinase
MMSEPSTASYVIAVAGPSGAGKTRLVRELVVRLGNATALFFDDYESSSTYPDIALWLANGADANQFRTPHLSEDLQRLRSGTAIELPDNKGIVEPRRVIVLEEPFGRGRDELAKLIDYVVCIDLPLEIALARKLSRTIDFSFAEQPADALAQYLRQFLPWYIDFGRDFYLAVNRRALANCDLVVDGMQAPDTIVEATADALRQRIHKTTTMSL